MGNKHVVAPSKESKIKTGLQPLLGTARILDGVHAPRIGQRLLWAVAEQKDGTEAIINRSNYNWNTIKDTLKRCFWDRRDISINPMSSSIVNSPLPFFRSDSPSPNDLSACHG